MFAVFGQDTFTSSPKYTWFALLVVIGLDNFRVGGYTSLPSVGTTIDPDSYTLCGDFRGYIYWRYYKADGTVTCTTPMLSQYVIVQSLDASPEQLCIAGVEMYAYVYIAGQYAITFELVQ